TSRKVLALIRDAGIEPEIIDYLKTPLSRADLIALAEAAGMPPRELLRETGTPYAELGLDDESLSDAALLEALERNPILLQRPIVTSARGTRLCRPAERVLDLLPAEHSSMTNEPDRAARAISGAPKAMG
ncbi:arsenate reductase family protein, partial [Thioclava sp. BHET1]